MPYFSDLREYVADLWSADWVPASRAEVVATLVFFAWFLWYAVGKQGGDFLFLDAGNLVMHEAGHPLFSYFGDFLQVAGGTIFQLLVPFLLSMAFYVRRQRTGFALFMLVVFENLLYVSHYMSTARSLDGEYVAIGAGAMSGDEMDPMMHDWHNLFSRFGVLNHDTQIAHVVFRLGWIGMIAVVAWYAWKTWDALRGEEAGDFERL